MGRDFLSVADMPRSQGLMSGALNSTFISHNPEKDKAELFSYFMPIAMYNLVYKLVTNIITNRIKPKLSRVVSKEQFGFLSNRQIMDAIGVSQECLHSVKVKKLNALILNMDRCQSL